MDRSRKNEDELKGRSAVSASALALAELPSVFRERFDWWDGCNAPCMPFTVVFGSLIDVLIVVSRLCRFDLSGCYRG